jgi:hypothetical protein
MLLRTRLRRAIVNNEGDPVLDSRVAWYDYNVHPGKRLAYWSFRHLRKIPPEWREYYRRLLYAEYKANQYLNKPWDIVMTVCEGYRKGKWITSKYGVTADEAAIPYPYNNFWEVTTHDERAWAHRRSFQLKELQAIQREDCDLYGNIPMDSREVSVSVADKNIGSKENAGNAVHSVDLPAPTESQIKNDDEMSHILMATMEDDRMWNPCLKAREHREKSEQQAELYGFEDEEEFTKPESATNPNAPSTRRKA